MTRVYALLAGVTVIAGLTPIAARMATAELPPLTIAVVRFGVAGLLLLLTARLLHRPWTFARGEWLMVAALGALCVPVNQVGFLFGVKLTNASHAGVAYALVPVLVFWVSLFLRRTLLSGRMIWATTLAFAGAALVVLSTTESASQTDSVRSSFWAGDGLLLSAATSWALFLVLSQPVVRRRGAVQTLSAVFLIGTAIHAPLVLVDYLYLDLGRLELSALTWRGISGLAYITLITAFANYLLWYLVLARFDVTRSSVVTNTAFLITVLVEAVIWDLPLSLWVCGGSAALLVGIILATHRARGAVAVLSVGAQAVERPADGARPA